MCGFYGIYSLGNKRLSKESFLKSIKTIEHRGPDDFDTYEDSNILLGHYRLAILDTTSAGKQPMVSRCKRYVIAFNGCIYNFRELKNKYLSDINFKSKTDTEVLLEGYIRFGGKFVKELNGMFAFCIYDTIKKEVHLVRDRYGIKPLYYSFDGERLSFGSEIKPIIQYEGFQTRINKACLNEYFSFQNNFTFRTLFDGVNMLPPANIVIVNKDSSFVKHSSYWDYNFEEDNSLNFKDSIEELNHLFQTATKRQLLSDVDIGSYLSGGMDSGAITSIASKNYPNLKTFTCGFDLNNVTGREANFDERRSAELMASNFNTEHYEQVLNSSSLKQVMPKLIYHLEDLRVGMSYPNYYISRLASKFVKVALQGTGGDELFGGYPWRYYNIISSNSRQGFYDQYFHFWQRLVTEEAKNDLFTNNVLSEIDINEPRKIFENVFRFNTSLKYKRPEDLINNSLYFEAKTFLPGLFLVGDKLAMAHGLEERFPFMDNDLVDFAMKVPVRFKLKNLEQEILKMDENIGNKKSLYREFDDGKNILRKSMAKILPKKILENKKQGFSSPDENWYKKENYSYLKDELLIQPSTLHEFVKKKFIKDSLEDHYLGKANNRLLLWSLLSFKTWCDEFKPTA